jgi:acetyl esterase/lipase
MKNSVAVLLLAAAPTLWAQDEHLLWEAEPPYSKPNNLEERVEQAWGVPCVVDVTVPTLTMHAARGQVAPQAVIIFPGGGYEKESFQAEGHEIAAVLASQGITSAVLKYRLPLEAASDQPHLLPESDARRAMSLMRSMADTYGFDASRVGVLGFSAGGHLATTISVLPSKDGRERPDFSILLYPAIPLTSANQTWLEETLFHRPMTAEERDRYSLVKQVTSATPPAFLAHAYDDDVVPIFESQAYAAALVAAGREVEVHFFAKGGHGFGAGRAEDGTGRWLELATDWIRRQ